jgi:mono/diheme cytochrome c family protein
MKMNLRRAVLLFAVLAVVPVGYLSSDLRAAPAQEPAQPLEFNRDIQPILARSCLACHGPNENTRQADLRLDTHDFIGTLVVPGDAEASPLFRRLTTGDSVQRMPPASSGRSLTDEQIEAVRLWIDGGAHWDSEVAVAADAAAVPARVVDFAREVRPILSEKCFTCHGPDAQARQRGLRLDVAEGPFAERGDFGGPVIVPGNAEESLLIHRVSASDALVRMPYRLGLNTPVMPGADEDALSPDQIETLRLWIDQGAEWQSHWAFIPPERQSVPPVAGAEWVRNPIDNFVKARLEQDGREPSPEADLLTLLRRATFDLTGLPPADGDIAAVLSDDSPDAYENAVDKMLGSSAFGERMAVDWLDAARYADSSGYQTDAERSMWRYRDWVIDAYNANMPFDQFTIEQIAGDLMPDATLEQRIATAFNRNHSQNGEGGIIPEEFLVENVVDRVSTTGTVWMGLTLGCARCHDHKFDPISQKEFYEIYAYFNNIPERGNLRGLGAKAFKYFNSPPLVTAPTDNDFAQIAELDETLEKAREEFASLETDAADARAEWESSLAGAWPVDWVLRDKLLVHHPLDGDIGGTYSGEPVFPHPGVTSHLRTPRAPVTYKFPINVTLEDGLPRFAPGRVGEAMSFDGKRFINAGDIANFTYAEPFTMGAWIYPTAPDGVIVSRALAGDQGERGWGLYLIDGKVRVNLSQRWSDDGVRVETVDDLPLNEWQHVLVTYDGQRVPESFRIYVNGESREINPLLDGINNPMRTKEPLRIGASGSAPEESGSTDSRPRFQGMIDDVRIYMTALTPEQAGVVATGESLSEIARIAPASRTAGQAEKLRLAFLDQYAAPEVREAWQNVKDMERERAALWDSFPTVMVMEEMEPRRDTFRLIRGAYDVPGERVDPGVPAVLPPMPDDQSNDRLGFARWLVQPDHPLTARVAVNRFWQMYFGTGLVKTAENFGTQGEYPSHPELLDWLATSFVDSGWDVKALQRTIVTSAAYRQASKVTAEEYEADPENRLIARGPRLRLPAQMIRDQALAVSGLLAERLGGPSVKPYQPEGLWADMVEGGYGDYVPSEGDDLYRRSLYTYWKRTLAPPSMLAFDSSTRETCIVRLSRTNTPLQALNLMNDVTYVEAARRLGERMIAEGGTTPDDRIAYAYRLATGHRPSPDAEAVLRGTFDDFLDEYQADRSAALEFVDAGETPRDETLDVAELASYTLVASLILNLDRTITKE